MMQILEDPDSQHWLLHWKYWTKIFYSTRIEYQLLLLGPDPDLVKILRYKSCIRIFRLPKVSDAENKVFHLGTVCPCLSLPGRYCNVLKNLSIIPFMCHWKAVLRSRSRKEPPSLVGAGAVTRCGSGSDSGINHG
jgi:hypothetical protein